MSEITQEKWDAIYSNSGSNRDHPKPAKVLFENRHLLPRRGRSLEVACGRGGNALLLAGHGFESHAWDISSVVIDQLQKMAEQSTVTVSGEVRDIMAQPPKAQSFDVIVVSHFLERGLFACLREALRPGGLLFYQTFTRTCVSSAGPTNEEYRLADNELLAVCQGMQVLVYREEGRVGDLDEGVRDVAMIVSQIPIEINT